MAEALSSIRAAVASAIIESINMLYPVEPERIKKKGEEQSI